MIKSEKKCIIFIVIIALLLSSINFVGCKNVATDNSANNNEVMAQSPWMSGETTNNSTSGLTDSSKVGINKDKFENEELYPVDKNATVIDAASFGVNGADNRDDTLALCRAISEAKKLPNATKKVIQLPSGSLDIVEGFNPINYRYGIYIEEIDNLTIAGNNTEIFFHATNNGFRGVYVGKCKNFMFHGINFDWATLPFAMGKIEEFNLAEKYAVVSPLKGYVFDSKTEVIEYLEYDSRNKLPRNNGNFLYIHNANKDITGVTYDVKTGNIKIQFNKTKLSLPLKATPLGTIVALANKMTTSETFFIERCENFAFEKVDLYASGGFAVKISSTKNIFINRFRCICKPNTNRLLTSTADILHLKNNAGQITITNSWLENSHDDAINIGGHYLRIKELLDGKVRVISPLGMGETFQPEVGDIMELTDLQSLLPIKDLHVIAVAECADGYYLTFAEGIEGLKIDNALGNITKSPSVIFKNNLIRNKRNRGLLLQSRNAVIENNTFSNVMHGSLLMICEVNVFHESISPKNIEIKNNKFLNNSQFADADIHAVAYGPNYVTGGAGAISEINIHDNFFAYSRNSAVAFQGVAKSKINNNLIYSPAQSPKNGATNSAIMLENVNNIEISHNDMSESGGVGYKSVFVNAGVDLKTVQIKENLGVDLDSIFGKLPDITVKKGGAITLDGDLSEWVNNTEIPIIAGADVHLNELYMDRVDKSDFAVKTMFTYTDNGLYMGFDVTDNELNFLEDEWWLGDGFEMFLTTELDSYDSFEKVILDNDSTLQLFARPDNIGGISFTKSRTSNAIYSKRNLASGKIIQTAKGYAGEICLPFTLIPNVLDAINTDKKVAVSFNFFDVDKTEIFRSYSSVRHLVTENKKISAKMNQIVFAK